MTSRSCLSAVPVGFQVDVRWRRTDDLDLTIACDVEDVLAAGDRLEGWRAAGRGRAVVREDGRCLLAQADRGTPQVRRDFRVHRVIRRQGGEPRSMDTQTVSLL